VSRRRALETWGAFALGLVITPLAMLAVATAVTSLVTGVDRSGEYGVAIAGARDLAAAVDRYRARYHHVPDEKQGLQALVPDFLDRLPLDPWGHPYVYQTTGPEWADVLSYGADGQPGGSGGGADISARFGHLGATPPSYLHQLSTFVMISLPLAAALLARRRRWCAGLLAGISAFWGAILLATVGMALRASMLPWLSFGAGVACLVGAIALLQRLAHATLTSLISITVAYLLLQYLVTS
jgi:general secretion pathway protein G